MRAKFPRSNFTLKPAENHPIGTRTNAAAFEKDKAVFEQTAVDAREANRRCPATEKSARNIQWLREKALKKERDGHDFAFGGL